MKYLISVVFFIAMIACSNDKKIKELEANNISIIENTTPQPVIKKYQITILDTIPKDTSHYTQGLVFHNKTLYEGTGNLGVSALIKYNSKYQIEKKIRIDDNFFGEGITVFNNKIFQLTWLNGKCIVWDLKKLIPIDTFSYAGEGWGITNNDSLLIMSDGTSTIRFVDPADLRVIKTLPITHNGRPLWNINELELIDGILFANILMKDWIAMIDLETGSVIGEIDASFLRRTLKNNPTAEVLNGIAWDASNKILYITGKNWNRIFKVKIEDY